jgi:hypothetical protein
MKTMATIDLTVTKEDTLDANVGELLNGRIEIACIQPKIYLELIAHI